MNNGENSNIKKLAALGALANATLDLDKLLRFLIDAIARLVFAEGGSVLLLEDDELVFVVATGQKGDSLSRMHLPKSKSIAWWVAEHGKTYISNNTKKDPTFSGSVDRLVGFSTQSVLAVPIKLDNEILGVMEAVNKRRGNFTGQDWRILEAFADLVAVAIRNAQIFGRFRRATAAQTNEIEADYPLVGTSDSIQQIRNVISQVASSPSTVLITGEIGVGKETVARQLHIMSNRASGPFIKVSCPSFAASALESELFGYERGSFDGTTKRRTGRFESADGGTIYFSEIAQLPPAIQSKLLRILQEGIFTRYGSDEEIHVDVRILAASNHDLHTEVDSGKFRQDLFFLLNVVPIHIPALRERSEDIPFLVEHFLEKLRRRFPHSVNSVSDEAMDILRNYPWAGNMRELENTIERIAVMHSPNEIKPEHLPPDIINSRNNPSSSMAPQQILKRDIEKALAETGGKISKAAKILRISKGKLRRDIEKYDINHQDYQ